MSLINKLSMSLYMRNKLLTSKSIWFPVFGAIILTTMFLYGEWQYDRAHNAGRVNGYDQAMLEILSESSVKGGFAITHNGTVINYTVHSVEEDAQ